MKPSKWLCFCLLVMSVVLLTARARQPVQEAFDVPGFFMGFWTGLTIFLALIGPSLLVAHFIDCDREQR